MNYEENDHLIIRSGNKNMLIRATGKKVGLQPEYGGDAESIPFSKHDVIANIGPDPEPGMSLLGCVFKPRRTLPVVDGWPKLVLYGSDELIKRITKAVKRTQKRVEANKFEEVLRRCTQVSFMQQQTKKSHVFRSKFQKEQWQDQITVFVDENMIVEDIEHNLLRAITESVHLHQTDLKRKIKWIVTFNKLRNIKKLSKDQLDGMLEDLINQGDCTDVKNVLPEELLPISDIIFRQIARTHSISLRELEALISEPETLRDMWPSELQIAEGRPDIDKSVLKSVTTLFSWAVTQHLLGTEVGKTLRKAVKNTLKEI